MKRKIIVQTGDARLFVNLTRALEDSSEELDLVWSETSVQTEIEQMVEQKGVLQKVLPGLPSNDCVVIGDDKIRELIQIATERHADDAVTAIIG